MEAKGVIEDGVVIEEIVVTCPNCHEDVDIDDILCRSCGAHLVGAETQATKGVGRKKRNRQWGVYGIMLFLVCPPLGIAALAIQRIRGRGNMDHGRGRPR